MAGGLPDGTQRSCPACGSPYSGDESVCGNCGVPRFGAVATEVCRIERWRGYVTSSFYAVRQDGAVLAESHTFRWRHKEPPPADGRAREAYDELLAELAADGWTLVDQSGRHWYGVRLVRTVAAPAAPIQAAPAQRTQETPVRPAEAPVPFPAAPAPRAPASSPPPRAEARPEATEASDEQTEPDGTPSGGRRRRVAVLLGVLGGAGVAAALLLSGLHLSGGGAAPAAAAAHEQQHTKRAATTSAARPSAQPRSPQVRSTEAASAPAAVVDLRIRAHGHGSWVEIRRGSKSGKVMYAGLLPKGHHLRFHAARLWVRLGAAGNLSITANGKPVPARGTYETVLTPSAN